MTLNKSRPWLKPWQWQLLLLSTFVKLLLIPTYHSTDFEVHRNWLAITHSLPVSQWYFDETSKWTLDYPPFFAYFSWILSVPAALFDAKIVDLHGGLDYAEMRCKVFMRLTVIITEMMTYASALFALSNGTGKHVIAPWCASAMLLHPGLIIIDHIHFQYNGFLYGILLWSVWAARENKPLLCAFFFSTLLNFKHIYVYVAPAYFVYLLQTYVIRGHAKGSVGHSGVGERLFTLAFITLLPFVVSLLPLALSGLTSSAPAGPIGILRQMLGRLFPFSRGLNHAYWAANVWALYTFADRVLVKLLHVESRFGNVTRGIIGDTQFDVLPPIVAGHCFLLTLAFTLLLCVRLWRKPGHGAFVESIGLFGLTSFLFGFHVHEKAILIALLPLTLLASCSYTMMRKTFVLSVAGVVGLFPLLFEVRELPIKLAFALLWLLVTPFASTFGMRFSSPSSAAYAGGHFTPTNVDLLIHFAEDVYVAGFVLLVAFVEVIHPLWLNRRASVSFGAQSLFTAASTSSSETQQNNLLSFASAAASSAVEMITNAVQTSSDTETATEAGDVAALASSAAAHATSAVASAGSVLLSGSGGDASPSIGQAASSAASIASAVLQSATSSAKLATFESTSTTSLEFLPLMLTSVYCAVGVVWVWFSLSSRFIRDCDDALDAENVMERGGKRTQGVEKEK